MVDNVVNFQNYKNKKASLEHLVRDRDPLYNTHLSQTGVTGTDFADRLVRIRASLTKINKLMAELKKSYKEGE